MTTRGDFPKFGIRPVAHIDDDRFAVIGYKDLLDAKIGAISWRHPAVPVHHLLVYAVFLTF